jgi:hypothetical protein
MRLGALVLIAPEPRNAGRRAKLPGAGFSQTWKGWRASRGPFSAVMSRRPRGSDGRSKQTEIIRHLFMFAAALAHLGRLDEAETGLALNSAFTVSRRPRRLDGYERQSNLSGSARTLLRRHAQGRSARGVTETRSSRQSSLPMSSATRAGWARRRRGGATPLSQSRTYLRWELYRASREALPY